MLIYWLLFAYPALMALAYPVGRAGLAPGFNGQRTALIVFALFYSLVSGLRYQTGGDWDTYTEMYDSMAIGSLPEALVFTDPLFGLLNWVSAQLDLGLFLVNGVCSLLLAIGTVRVASRLSEPWLGVLAAVPYLLIVVGMGYIRQGAAIGLLLMAIADIDRVGTWKTVTYLALAALFHSSAAVAFPMFAWAFAKRSRGGFVLLAIVATGAFMLLLAPRLETFEQGYLEAEYDSSGAITRILMSVLPSIVLLLGWRKLNPGRKMTSVWISIAIANLVALAGLSFSSSSTAVDRIALYFSVIQIATCAEIAPLIGARSTTVPLLRVLLIGIYAAVQVVFVLFATHAYLWVPYRSILELL